MDCIKCQGKLSQLSNSRSREILYCTLCKGLWMSRDAVAKVFKNKTEVIEFLSQPLGNSKQSNLPCPDCQKNMTTGFVLDSKIVVEKCESCDYYFFDNKEINRILDHIVEDELPKARDIDWSKEELVEGPDHCPVCVSEPLFGLKNRLDVFEVCLKCNGVASKVEVLQKLANKSLFGPTMFEFRRGAGLVSLCRMCQTPQQASNSNCVQCGTELKRIKCVSCESQYSEYQLDDVIIDRCQICNSLWLDHGEFEKVMTIMPDYKKVIDRMHLKDQLTNVKLGAISESYAISIERDRRHIVNRFWGPIVGAFFFY